MSRVRLGGRLLAAVATAGLLVALTPTAASAHSVLLGTSPADETRVTTVTDEVTLTFNEPVQADFSTIVVTGPDGANYADGALTVLDAVVHQVVYPLRSGDYRVAWRVVSADGHPVSGTFGFTVALPAELEPTGGPPTAPSASAATPAEDGWPAWWWAVPVGLAAAVGGFLLLRSRSRRSRPGNPHP